MDESLSSASITKSVSTDAFKAVVKKLDPAADLTAFSTGKLTLTARVNRRCWLLGATHEHETFVEDEQGNRFSVDKLVLHREIGGDYRDLEEVNTSQVARTETEVNMGCRSSGCKGTATFQGLTWSTDWVRA